MKTIFHEGYTLQITMSSDTRGMTRHEILKSIGLLRAQTDRLLEQMKHDAIISANENDSLYHELEQRYGGGVAQWVVDGLNRSTTSKA